MIKKLNSRLICLLTATIMVLFVATGCEKSPAKPAEPNKLALELSASLKTYLNSEEFKSAMQEAHTARERTELMYLKYVDGTFYGTDNVVQLKKYLNYINYIVENSELSDALFASSPASEQGWYGITDFLFGWSFMYNQYLQYCAGASVTDTSLSVYLPMIKSYLQKTDAFLQNNPVETPSDAPVIKVAWGFSATNVLPMIAANLGIYGATPYCDGVMLSYYEKDENGKFIKEGDTPDWVGFSGRPMCASLYRANEKYSLAYEKTMQGYFPFTDGWNQPLEEMVNLDRLCNYYNRTLSSGASAVPEYALLTAMMHGIDMENYVKESPAQDENGDETFNVISLWREELTVENGEYIINNFTDMAVAIAYIAQSSGIAAPTPLGSYSGSSAVIKL